jgi:uncharacterized protein YnzC (UPF0291/DUF896 family)
MPEDVIERDGHYEIDQSRMKKVSKSVIKDMTKEEIAEVTEMRKEYMRWMHGNFAKKVLKPPNDP